MESWINIYKDRETPVGAGYYALRSNIANSSKREYSKLVKRDRSPTISLQGKGVPSVEHNERRQQILDKRSQHGNS